MLNSHGGHRAAGDLMIRWTRRSRALSADSWVGVEVPLIEQTESYEIEILDGAVVKRTLRRVFIAVVLGGISVAIHAA